MRLIGVVGLVLLAGSLRFQLSVEKNNLSQFYDQDVVVSGVIVEEPDIRSDKIYLTLGKLSVNDQHISDKILVSVYPYRNFNYGDRLVIEGEMLEPMVFEDFNYKNYLSRFGIDAVMYYPDVEIQASDQGNKIKSSLLLVKQKFVANLTNVLPEPQNAFLGGLLVGQKRSIPENLTNEFNKTGTSHIVALSGFNIAIIIFALDWALVRFGRRTSLLANTGVILCFVILTGASSSVIRAAVMGAMILTAKNIGRLFHPTNALVSVCAVMLIINPKLLLFDVGFQLSFLALAGLVYLMPILSKVFSFVPRFFKEFLVATLAAQIFTLPVLLYNFDQLSLIAPITNVLVLPIVPPTMLFGFLTGLAGFIWEPIASILAWPTWTLLSYIIQVIHWTASIPYAAVSVHMNLPILIIYYLTLAGILVNLTRQKLIQD